ncbi:MAG: hypothetical protein RLN88_14085 [Ekhidna sp.]|uniref:hypothetical protein n=1 Tax=Ekhidna sp. TaxID=2608089 RepID=UPI0032ECA4D1
MEKQNHQFETNVLILACGIGLLRSLLEVIMDLTNASIEIDFYLDLAFVFVFGFALLAVYWKLSLFKIYTFFYVPFIILLALMLIEAEGLARSIENNIYGGVIIIAFTLRGRGPVYFISLLIFAAIVSLLIVEYINSFSESFTILNDSPYNFVFSSVGAIGFTLYAKVFFDRKKRRLAMLTNELMSTGEKLKVKNDELTNQKIQLEELNQLLDEKVAHRTENLKKQQGKMEEYLSITLSELEHSYQQIQQEIAEIKTTMDAEGLISLLLTSADNLQKEMNHLRSKIKEAGYEI